MTGPAGTTVRPIDPDEVETWGRLGGDDILDTAQSLADMGSSGPDRWLVAEREGQPVGRLGVFAEDAGCGLGLLEHHLFGIWLGDGTPERIADTGRALARAALATLPPGRQTIDLRSNPERHHDIEARRALLASPEPDPWRYTLWRLLVDSRHQRRGYGRAALDLVIDYLASRPDATELITSAVPGEGSPLPFYERYGFVQTGEVHEGEVVLRLAPLPRHQEAP